VSSPAPARPVRWIPATLAVALLALSVAHNLHWMRGHLLKGPPLWDQGLYLFLSLRYFHAWQDGGVSGLLREVQGLGEPQPPFLPLTAVPLYAAFSDSRLAAYASSTLFGALLLAATGLLARRRTGDWGGLLALTAAATFSAPMLLARDYQMDLPAAALLTAALLAVERSDGFLRRGPSLAAGALAGLMALTKTMSGPFLVAPALYAASRSWRGADRRRALANVLASAALALAIAALWWGPHLRSAVAYLMYYGWGPGSAAHDPIGGGSLLAPRNLAYYVVAFANEGGSVAFLALAMVLLAVEAVRRFRSRSRPPLDGLMWTWLAAGYVLLTASRNKASDRYVIFIIPPIVVLLTSALLRQRGPWKRVGVAAMLAAGAANFVAHTWPASGVRVLKWKAPLGLQAYTPDRTWLRSTLDIPDADWPVGPVVSLLGAARMAHHDALRGVLVERALATAATPEDQVRQAFRALLRRDPEPYALRVAAQGVRDGSRPLAQAVAALAASTEAELRPLRVLVLPDHPFVNASTFRYHAEWARAPVTFARIEPGQPPPELEDFDAVVVKTGYLGPPFATRWAGAVEERLRRSRFGRLPSRFVCPDDSEVRVHLLGAAGR
jgi:4-amino-4-deoxy-L-arabinose transferase-like glycosyltransferase